MDKVAIVILNWNGQAMLSQYLPTVIEYSRDEAAIVVADNGSTDDSLDMLRSRFPEVRIVELDKNYGFADGYNRALKQVDAEYYLLPVAGLQKVVVNGVDMSSEIRGNAIGVHARVLDQGDVQIKTSEHAIYIQAPSGMSPQEAVHSPE